MSHDHAHPASLLLCLSSNRVDGPGQLLICKQSNNMSAATAARAVFAASAGAMAKVCLVMAAGVAAASRPRAAPLLPRGSSMTTLSRLTLNLFFPCLTFSTLARGATPSLLHSLWPLPLGCAFTVLFSCVVAARRRSISSAASYRSTSPAVGRHDHDRSGGRSFYRTESRAVPARRPGTRPPTRRAPRSRARCRAPAGATRSIRRCSTRCASRSRTRTRSRCRSCSSRRSASSRSSKRCGRSSLVRKWTPSARLASELKTQIRTFKRPAALHRSYRGRTVIETVVEPCLEVGLRRNERSNSE